MFHSRHFARHSAAVLLALCTTASLAAATTDPVKSVSQQPDGVIFHTQNGTLRLQVWSPTIIRETFDATDRIADHKSLAVIGSVSKTPWKLTRNSTSATVTTSDLKARVDLATGAVTFSNLKGQILLAEDPSGRTLKPVVLPGPTPIDAYSSEDDFIKDPDEDVYGLGEHQNHQGGGQSDHLDYRNTSVRLEQDYIDNLDIPLLVSSKGYGVFWNNPATTTVGTASAGGDIPSAQLLDADGNPGGLTGQYYTGQNFDTLVKTQVDPNIDFVWTQTPPSGLPHDNYSVRWTGSLLTTQGGDYTLTTTSDDGVRLWIDGKQVIDDWSERPAVDDSVDFNFAPNSKHAIRMEYFQAGRDAIAKLTWSRSSTNLSWKSEAAQNIDYYFIYGPSIDHVISNYRTLTGAAPMPPIWALGYWQSKEHYATQDEWLDIASTYRAKQEPIDNIVQDWFYWDPYPWGSHIMDPKRYPDPAAAIKTLHDVDHMHIMISVWGIFAPDNTAGPDANYNALNSAGYLYPDAVRSPDRFYDAFNPAARAMYWGFMRDELFGKGFDAWWLDASEPEANFDALRQTDTAAGRGALVLNAWPLEHTRTVYEGQRQAAPNQRVFILTRSAFAGEQRNAATVWSSDITGSWDVFKHQIPNSLNMGLSSIPYWSSDTGGFFCNYSGGSSNPEYGELFTRWFQFSSFCSIFRVHGTNTPKEMWRFGPTYEPILVKFDNLRYRLMPYLYSQAWNVTHNGGTIMRALVFDFPNDKTARELSDEYLFGPSILVAPVVKQGAINRDVYLPTGVDWYDFWTGQLYKGGQTISAPAPIDTMPLYVKAGSIVPMGPFEQYTGEKPAAAIDLRVYEGKNASFTLYEDEGTNYNYEHGKYAVIPINWNDSTRKLTIGARTGSFAGMVMRRQFNIIFVRPGVGNGLDLSSAKQSVNYSGFPVSITHVK